MERHTPHTLHVLIAQTQWRWGAVVCGNIGSEVFAGEVVEGHTLSANAQLGKLVGKSRQVDGCHGPGGTPC